jgi:hypothetical protein
MNIAKKRKIQKKQANAKKSKHRKTRVEKWCKNGSSKNTSKQTWVEHGFSETSLKYNGYKMGFRNGNGDETARCNDYGLQFRH